MANAFHTVSNTYYLLLVKHIQPFIANSFLHKWKDDVSKNTQAKNLGHIDYQFLTYCCFMIFSFPIKIMNK